MAGNQDISPVQVFECYDRLSCKGSTVECERELHVAACVCRAEDFLCRDLFPADTKGFSGLLVHQDPPHDIFRTRLKVRAGDGIREIPRVHCLCAVAPRLIVDEDRADGRAVHRLCCVRDVRMDRELHAVLEQGLKCDHGSSCEGSAVYGELQIHGAVRPVRRELCRAFDGFVFGRECLLRFFVHQDAGDFVGLSRDQVFVGYGIRQGDCPYGGNVMRTGSLVFKFRPYLRIVDGLVLIAKVLMGCDVLPVPVEVFESHDRLPRKG